VEISVAPRLAKGIATVARFLVKLDHRDRVNTSHPKRCVVGQLRQIVDLWD